MENHICPKCKGEEIKKGVMGATVGQVHMYPENKLRSKPSTISTEYCGNCGYIMSFYVDNPEDLG
ncbi:acetyltransferase [Gottfriedia luciferensis]|uniref:acetyltransferase n=1 Tax=Gottfriedia luciferensis TaxID=178774 RepID=UPI000B4313DD|nr:acetyltransferase [Gottfriedia luciferensis]